MQKKTNQAIRPFGKRRLFMAASVAVLLFCGAAGVYAVERIIVPDMTFGGNEIKLSLTEAVKIMQTEGSRAETAAANKKSDDAIARGYSESAESIRDMLSKFSALGGAGSIEVSVMAEQSGATELNEKITKLRRDFAKGQLEANYKAEMNQIEAETISIYYGVLQAEENQRVAKENLANQQKIYNNTMKKFKLGTVAKIDTLTAESDLLGAKNQAAFAETAVNSAKMNLNLLLGYDLMQKVTLTDTLKMVDAPEGNLTGFIEKAIGKRNEIKGAAFAANIQEILLYNLKYRYPANSSTYLKQQVAYEQSKKQAEDAPIQIEMDLRIKYMDLADKKRAVEAAKATLANAKEGYRLAAISYDVGMNTLTDVQTAQIRSFQAGQALAKAITDYDLAVYSLKHAIDVGTMRLPL